MRDEGHDETEEILKEIEKRISEVYAQAEKEVAATLDEYLRKFEAKDKLKLKALANGLITEEEYKQWRVGQIAIGQRWSEMRDTLAQDFTNADKIARSIAFDHMPEVYAINHNYGTFQVEKASGIDTSYTLYDTNAFEELMKNEDTFIPAPGRKVSRDIKEGKALAWNKKAVQSAMMQSLLQGESIPKIATRLAKTVGESDRKAAIRNARTLTTGVENAGRIASYDQANKMGIPTRKQWLATLDSRTRHWHASLDGETVDNDKPFVNEFGEIMFPGDPKADPANIFNCRCTLIASIKGFERDVSDLSLRHDDHLKDMTYDEWKAGHYEQTSDSQDKQDQTEETMRYAYGAEYKKYKSLGEQESSRNHGEKYTKDTQINPQKCKGESLKKRVDAVTDSVEESREVYKAANEILIHRDKTHFEDLAYVFDDGKYLINKSFDSYDPVKKISACAPSKAMTEELGRRAAYSVIGIHNHPSSFAPSDNDIYFASARKYKYGLVFCHNGTIYKYHVEDGYNNISATIYLDKLGKAVYNGNQKEIEESIAGLRDGGIRMEVFL